MEQGLSLQLQPSMLHEEISSSTGCITYISVGVSQQLEQRLGTRNGNGLLLVIQLVLSDFVWIASSNLQHILIIRMARLITEELQKVECGESQP